MHRFLIQIGEAGGNPYAPRRGPTVRRKRRGSLMIDATIALMLLAIAMTLTVRIVGWTALDRRDADRRQRATSEVVNALEQIATIPYESLTRDTIKQFSLSPQAKSLLPGAELGLDVVENDPVGGEGSKRVTARIRWRDRSGEWQSPVTLTTWTYRRAGR
jgi:hypothetical protein